MKKIAIIGAGGFGREIFCVWRDSLLFQNIEFEFVGFFDDGKKGEITEFGKVVGLISEINTITEEVEVTIAIGNSSILKKIREGIDNENISFPNIIHPTSKFLNNNNFKHSEGNIFSVDTIVSNEVAIGKFNLFNTRATLGHDVTVGDYNIFSPNVQISGEVKIGSNNLFGFNSGAIQQVTIGDNNIIGVGSLLLRNVGNNGTYIGTPAKKFNT